MLKIITNIPYLFVDHFQASKKRKPQYVKACTHEDTHGKLISSIKVTRCLVASLKSYLGGGLLFNSTIKTIFFLNSYLKGVYFVDSTIILFFNLELLDSKDKNRMPFPFLISVISGRCPL